MAISSSDYEMRREFARDAQVCKGGARFHLLEALLADGLWPRAIFERFIRSCLLRMKEEEAHNLTLKLLQKADSIYPTAKKDSELLAQTVFGLKFPNPVGVAAGLDKDAEAVSPLLEKIGFGFVEVGTVTSKPQGGNAKPRVFRLPADEAIINRFGFNSDGADEVLGRLVSRANQGGIVGVNIGANRDSSDRVADYVRLTEAFAPVASYITVNVSSPNTPGLRDLQRVSGLDELLARVIDARDRMHEKAGPTAILLKIAPDLSLSELDDIVGVARARKVDGMIVSNTTLSRPPSLREREKSIEQGGLSGRPIFALSTRMLAETYVRTEGAFALIGVGGIDSGETAVEKIKAGASLVQLYSALVFKGLGLVSEIKQGVLAAMAKGRHNTLADMVGGDAADMTADPWPV